MMTKREKLKFGNFFDKLWKKVWFRIVIFILAAILCYGFCLLIDYIESIIPEEGWWQQVFKNIFAWLKGKASVILFIGYIYAAIKSYIKTKKEKREEEEKKIETDQHKIIRKYCGKNGHQSREVNVLSDFYSYEGDIMQLHHLNDEYNKKLKPFESDKFEDSYKFEKDMIDKFTRTRDGDKDIPYLNISTLNLYTNCRLDTKLSINDHNDMHVLPNFIIENSERLLEAHKYSTKKNSTTIRLKDFHFDPEKRVITFDTERTQYFQMLLTNRCMDYRIGSMSIRDLYEYHSKITPLNQSVLGNQIGVNGIIITADGYLLIEHRGLNKTTWKDKFGQPISFAIKENELFDESDNIKLMSKSNVEDKVMSTIKNSLKNNYGFVCGEDYDDISFSQNFMGLARDLLEGGKPNIYFYVVLKEKGKEVAGKMQHYASLIENEGNHKPIKSGKIKDSKYYLIKYSDIKVLYDYEMIIPKNSIKVGREFKPRFKHEKWRVDEIKYVKKPIKKECGEALLACFSYLEILQCQIPAIQDVKVTSYGELMVRHAIKGCNDFESYDNNPSAYTCNDTFGGTECNVLIGLESLGINTRYATCFPKDNVYSEKALELLKKITVDTNYIDRNGDKFGEYSVLLDSNLDRNKKTRFNRVGSAINSWNIDDFNFNDFFKGVMVFHLSGISLSLDSEGMALKNAKRFVEEAKKKNVKISFDFNYRPNMYEQKVKEQYSDLSSEEISEKALEMAKKNFIEVIPDVNIMLASNLDLIKFLNMDPLVVDDIEELQKCFFSKYPNCKYLVVRNREKLSKEKNTVIVSILTKDNYYKSKKYEFNVIEPIGGGDAFDAAILYRLCNYKEENLEETVDFAIRCFILKHQIKGDYLHDISAKNIYYGTQKDVNRNKILLAYDKVDDDFKLMENRLSNYGDVDVVEGNPQSLKGYNIYIGKRMNQQLLSTADELKAIFAYKTGVDDFPIKELDGLNNIKLYNSHIDSTIIAQYAFSLAMSLVTRVTEFDKKLRKGMWEDVNKPYWKSIYDMKIGLLGFGQIGQAINKILIDNGIPTYTIKRSKENKYKSIMTVDSLDELLYVSDLIIVSLPKTSKTDNMFNKDTLAKMNGKYLVNVGRSNCINEKDLYDALVNHIIAGAAIDTWESKGRGTEIKMPSQYPFQDLDNIILSPHQAMKVSKGHSMYVKDTTENVISYITSGKANNQVDYKKEY